MFKHGFLRLTSVVLLSLCTSAKAYHDFFPDWGLFFNNKDNHAGRESAVFLRIPGGARYVGMGNSGTALCNDPDAFFWNPAGMAAAQLQQLSFSHQESQGSFKGLFRHETIGYLLPYRHYGVFGTSARLLSTGTIEGRTAQEEPYSYYDLEFMGGVGWARSFYDQHVNVGASASGVYMIYDDEKTSTYKLDVGMQTRQIANYVHFGLSLQHMGPSIVFVQDTTFLPFTMRVGAAVTVPQEALTIAFDLVKSLGLNYKLAGGAEYWVKPFLAVRSGWNYVFYDEDRHEDNIDFTLGLGYQDPQYAVDFVSEYGGSAKQFNHLLTFTLSYPPLRPYTAEDYYRKALRKFQKKKYQRAITSAESALRLNPNDWQSQALIQRAHDALQRKKGFELTLLYTGNTRGSLIPELYENAYLGGMAKRGTLINRLRKMYPFHVLLDAGDILGREEGSLKNEVLLKCLKKIRYDALNMGNAELGGSERKFLANSNKFAPLPWISSHVTLTPSNINLRPIRLISVKKKYSVAVLGVVFPESVYFSDSIQVNLRDPFLGLKERIDSVSQSSTLKVVLASGTLEQAQKLASQVAGIDVVICSDDRMEAAQPISIGKTLVISTGRRGEWVGELTFEFDLKGKRMGQVHQFHAVSEDLEDERELVALLKPVVGGLEDKKNPKIHFPENLEARTPLSRNEMLFVSDRSGNKEIYLSSTKNQMVYRLTTNQGLDIYPQWSPQGDRILFISQRDSLGGRLNPQNRDYDDLFMIDRDSRLVQRLTNNNSQEKDALWTQDGQTIIFSSNRDGLFDLYKMNYQGLDIKNITRTSRANEQSPVLSPDGKTVAFETDRDGTRQIYLMGLGGESPLRLTKAENDHFGAVFSPDGKRVALVQQSKKDQEMGDLRVLSIDGREDLLLTHQAQVRRGLLWTPDGKSIIFISGLNITDLNMADIRHQTQRKLIPTNTEGIQFFGKRNPCWYSLNPQRLLFEVYSGAEKAIFLYDFETNQVRSFMNSDGSDGFLE